MPKRYTQAPPAIATLPERTRRTQASYIGKKVVIAVKAGGDDPDTNLALAAVIRESNALNVPKDVRRLGRLAAPQRRRLLTRTPRPQVIERNVKKAMDPGTAAAKELTYEAYGIGGVGLIINVLSDNNNRATADVNMIVTKARTCRVRRRPERRASCWALLSAKTIWTHAVGVQDCVAGLGCVQLCSQGEADT